MLPHSEAKLSLYQQYLEKYLNILCLSDNISHIHIYDVFCGEGFYQNEKEGSPILAYKCIKNVQCVHLASGKQLKPISLLCNDYDANSISKVESCLKNEDADSINCKISYYNLPSTQMFDKIIQQINTQQRSERNLIFIDPYGYKDIHKNDIYRLLNNRKTEILLFLPISFIYRFTDISLTDTENPKYNKIRDFISEFFNRSHPINNAICENAFELIQYIKQALEFNQEYYTTYYYIERSKSNYFALFFITSNLLGLEKVLESKWDLDELNGEGFNYISIEDENPLFASQIKEEKKVANINNLVSLIKKYISQTTVDNKMLYEYILRNDFLPKHANIVLKMLQENSEVLVWDIEKDQKSRKGSFYLSYRNYKDHPKVSFKYLKGDEL